MTVREYVGARYVPLYIGDWDNTVTYEPLSIVTYQGNSYTSRQYVPSGIDINNTQYWICSGNYNAQVEAYRQEVVSVSNYVSTLETTVGDNSSGLVHDVAELQTTVGDNSSGLVHDVDALELSVPRLELDIERQKMLNGILSKCGRDFEIVDRFIIDRGDGGEGYHTDRISSVQNGICFIQNNTRYYAQFILYDDDSYNDLYIRNLDSHTTVSRLQDVTNYHDPSLTYIGGYLYCVDDTNKQLIKINVTNPSNPSFTTQSLAHTTHYDLICFTSSTEYCGLSSNGATIDFYEIGNASMVDQLQLSSPALMTNSVIQSMFVNNDYIVFGHWQPNAVSIFNMHTGDHIKTIGMETWYDFVPCQEVESATIADDVLYVNLGQTLEGYNLPCILAVPLDNTQTFKPSTNPFVFESNDTGTYRRQVYVNNETGKLFQDTNSYPNRFVFKFATDAANALRSIGSGGTINFSASSYPRFVALFDGVFRIAHSGSNIDTEMAGLRFVNCVVNIIDFDRFNWVANNKYNDSEWNAIYCLGCVVNANCTSISDWRSIEVEENPEAANDAKARLLHLRQCQSMLPSPKNCRVEYGSVDLRYNAATDTNCVLNYSCVNVSTEPDTFSRD